jgi:hypothetical protein
MRDQALAHENSVSKFDIERCNFDTWDANLRDIGEIYAEFSTLGISTVPASRINAYRDAFQSLMNAAGQNRKLDLSLAVRVLNGLVEFHQLRTILKAAQASSNEKEWKIRLRQLVSGAELVAKDTHLGSSRDFQFESFVGAVCELSGYAVRFDEPDIVVTNAGHAFGIAAKRPRNERKIERNCRKAAGQIRKSRLPGLIAIDLSFALHPDQCINTNDLRGGQVFVQEVANRFVHGNYNRLRDLCSDPDVLGVLFHAHMPVISFGNSDGPQLATAIRWTVAPFCEPNTDGFIWATAFCSKCEIGLFGHR